MGCIYMLRAFLSLVFIMASVLWVEAQRDTEAHIEKKLEALRNLKSQKQNSEAAKGYDSLATLIKNLHNPNLQAQYYYSTGDNLRLLNAAEKYTKMVEEMQKVLPDTSFPYSYLEQRTLCAYYVFNGKPNLALTAAEKAISLLKAQPSLPNANKKQALLELELEFADVAGRSGHRQRDVELVIPLIPKLKQENMHHRVVQAYLSSLVLHSLGFKEYEKCLAYADSALAYAKEHGIEHSYIGLYEYQPLCLAKLGREAEARKRAAVLSRKIENHPLSSRNDIMFMVSSLQHLARYHNYVHQRDSALIALQQAAKTAELMPNAWSAKSSAYSSVCRMAISNGNYPLAQQYSLKQVGTHLKNHTPWPNPIVAPELSDLNHDMYTVSALNDHAEVMYRMSGQNNFKDSLHNAAIISFMERSSELFFLVLEKLPDYASRMRYLERTEWFLTFYATGVFQQYQNEGVPVSTLERFLDITSYYRQQLLRSSLDKREKSSLSGSDSLLQQLVSLNSQYQKVRFSENIKERDSLENLLMSLNNRLSTENPVKYRAFYEREHVKIDELQKKLDTGECLVVYEKFYINLYQMVISANSVKFDYLYTTPTLDSLLEANRKAMQTGNAQQYASSSHKLFKRLALDSLDFRKYYVVPVANLHLLPFEALVTDSGSFETFSQMPFWLNKADIHVLPSVFDFRPDQKAGLKVKEYLAVAPRFQTEAESPILAMRSADRNLLVHLPGALKEVEHVSKLFPKTRMLVETMASEKNFKQQAQIYDVLHFATHALLDEDPLQSRLIFGDTDSTDEDGFLYTQELMTMELNAGLAILSACNTGSAQSPSSQGYLSLAYAFAYSGCPNVLMTLWNSSDEASSQIVSDFMKGVAKGEALGTALQAAKRTYLATSDDVLANPLYWAGYGLYGNPDGQLEIAVAQKSTYGWMVLSGLVLLAGAWGVRRFRRNS